MANCDCSDLLTGHNILEFEYINGLSMVQHTILPNTRLQTQFSEKSKEILNKSIW